MYVEFDHGEPGPLERLRIAPRFLSNRAEPEPPLPPLLKWRVFKDSLHCGRCGGYSLAFLFFCGWCGARLPRPVIGRCDSERN